MTKEALTRVRALLAEADDTIYKDARQQRITEGENFAYTEDETTLTTIVDEAQGQVIKMLEAA